MSAARTLDRDLAPATDGGIAALNLEGCRRQSWSQFWRAPHRPGIAEAIVEQEHLAIQFLGDMVALDRLHMLASELDRVDPGSPRRSLVHAQVASMAHRFAVARDHLAEARSRGAAPETIERLSLSIDQACGTRLDLVLAARRRRAVSQRLEDLVPLGALLADMQEFDEADAVYRLALRTYQDLSPFAFAWACFQLGALWGELVPDPQPRRAATWYETAIDYLPGYVKARVHLAEIYLSDGRLAAAAQVLTPAIASGDPEAHWRLADILAASGKPVEAGERLLAARVGFEGLLERHVLAFADHGAEFYAGSGNDPARALRLVTANIANRPTRQAFEQAYGIAVGIGDPAAAATILAQAEQRLGASIAGAIHAAEGAIP